MSVAARGDHLGCLVQLLLGGADVNVTDQVRGAKEWADPLFSGRCIGDGDVNRKRREMTESG